MQRAQKPKGTKVWEVGREVQGLKGAKAQRLGRFDGGDGVF